MFAVVGGDLGYDNGRSVDISLAFLRNYSKNMIGRDGRLIPHGGLHRQPRSGRRLQQDRATRRRSSTPSSTASFPRPATPRSTSATISAWCCSTPATPAPSTARRPTGWRRRCRRGPIIRNVIVDQSRAGVSVVSATRQGKNGKSGTGEGNRKHWVPLFEKYRVPVVLEHHDHTFKRTKPLLDGLAHDNGVLYLGDGSWGRLRTPNSPEKLPYLAASSRDYHLSLHRIQGQGAVSPGPRRKRPRDGCEPHRATEEWRGAGERLRRTSLRRAACQSTLSRQAIGAISRFQDEKWPLSI